MWNERATQALLIIVGLVHVLPSFVAFSPDAAQTAYGIDLTSGDVEVLLRHRAVLLGLLGCGLIVAAFMEALRTAMIGAAAVSMGTFLVLVATTEGLNAETLRVAWIDVAALVGLALAVAALPAKDT